MDLQHQFCFHFCFLVQLPSQFDFDQQLQLFFVNVYRIRSDTIHQAYRYIPELKQTYKLTGNDRELVMILVSAEQSHTVNITRATQKLAKNATTKGIMLEYKSSTSLTP